jgi:5'(3')-deoxyribonucleotidase
LGVPESQAFNDKQLYIVMCIRQDFSGAFLIPGSVSAVKTLMEHFDVYIVSAAMEFPFLYEKNNGWKNIFLLYPENIVSAETKAN